MNKCSVCCENIWFTSSYVKCSCINKMHINCYFAWKSVHKDSNNTTCIYCDRVNSLFLKNKCNYFNCKKN